MPYMSDLYPNWGTETTHESTTPNEVEQEAYANVETAAPAAIKPNQGKHMIMTVAAILLLIVFLGK